MAVREHYDVVHRPEANDILTVCLGSYKILIFLSKAWSEEGMAESSLGRIEAG